MPQNITVTDKQTLRILRNIWYQVVAHIGNGEISLLELDTLYTFRAMQGDGGIVTIQLSSERFNDGQKRETIVSTTVRTVGIRYDKGEFIFINGTFTNRTNPHLVWSRGILPSEINEFRAMVRIIKRVIRQ